MAKKRKREKAPEEEYEFVPPEFSEKEFLEREMRDTKTVMFTVIYAVVFGVAAALISYASNALIGLAFLLGIAGIFSLKYVYPIVKIDISAFKRKNWAGNVAWFFLTFLAIWILMFNVPFADYADPDISDIIVWVETPGNITGIEYKYVKTEGDYVWVPMFGETLGSIIHPSANCTVNVTARVADNGDLDSVMIQIPGVSTEYLSMSYEGSDRYNYSLSGSQLSSAGELRFTVLATDSAGHEKSLTPSRAIPLASS